MWAADTCIDQGILEDLLKKQKAEVVRMALENYDLEKYEKAIKKESYEEGVEHKYDLSEEKAEEYMKKYW